MQSLAAVPDLISEARTYPSPEVAGVTGASIRQLNYWVRTGLIPGMPRDLGSGNPRRWTAEQLEVVRWLRAASRAFVGSGGNPRLRQLADFVKRAAAAGIEP